MADITKANTFITWLRSKGGEFHQSAQLQIDPETGLSPISTSIIGPDERLVSCPFDLAITSELATQALCEITNTTEEDLVWPAESSRQGENWNARMRIGGYLGLHWIYQDKKKVEEGSSFPPALQHLPYLDALPPSSTLTTPLYFSEGEVELLKGSTLYGGVKARKEEWKAECEVVRKVLKEDGLTWERYLATSTYMSSRSFPSKLLRIPDQANSATHEAKKDDGDEESQPVLLPGLDLFNHSRGQPILWLSSLIPSCTSPNQPIPSISLVSTQPTEKNTQLYNNYGPKSNEELLLGYGFVIPSNPDDTVSLKLGLPNIPRGKLEKLKAKGLDANKRFELTRDGELDKDLLEILRIILNEHDHEHEHEIDEEDEHALHAEEEREMQLELDVLGMLGGMLDDKLEKLQDTPEEIDGKIREDVRKMCEIYKQGQMDILNTAMDKLSERIERIEGLIDEGMGGCPCGC
ncbi:hypothetical protein I302_104089 [Kwoniella bestiolae CBS 10118]|uniref:Cytoplasmic protein n=1 Tax=Kwoniella bestiolae CBS 10118 TaxID=1296100 RepID=A0A1B9GAA1_9TREE|nr:cytoplasmic protein [Kwoniella bestiolae CBS 10118]OCF27945.1 cytoplasmic protein [Kwoniella bestiolae CBS 10118]